VSTRFGPEPGRVISSSSEDNDVSTVVVAMSGGVDSSVTAALLHEQGHDVVGVHMKLTDEVSPSPQGSRTCCGLDDAQDARRVCDELGVPFYVLDLRREFKRAVIDDFTQAYRAGLTPNPCIQCNGVLKFKVLLKRALMLGASHLATGHYCRIAVPPGRGPMLQAAVDRQKDQSYFLFPLHPKALAHTLFPLGGLKKDEVRGLASRFGLATASKPESQDICFLPRGNHAELVAQSTDLQGAGEIVDEQGRVLGTHRGYWRYTVGQRRGLGVAAPEPLYVLRVEPNTRRVVVGPNHRLGRDVLRITECHWADRPHPDRVVQVRIRHQGSLVPCRVGHGDEPTVTLLEEVRAIAPGQAAVFYDDDLVLGGGWITSAVEAS